MTPTAPRGSTDGYRRYVLAMLVAVYAFNFIDRQIVAILIVPIRTEFQLSDTQSGLLGGLWFALFYTFLGIPIGRLADRANRTWIMTVALSLWSLMTAACGYAQSFVQLCAARLGVGVGEAGGVAPAYSVICDYFAPGERARALSIYAFGVPIGSAIALLFGGYAATHLGWRATFVAVGVAGLVLAPLFRLTVREPVRGTLDPVPMMVADSGVGAVLSHLAGKRSFWALALGSATASMAGYALFYWMPSLLVRSFAVSLSDASRAFGLLVLVGGAAGMWMGGVLGDRLGARRKSAYALVPACAFLTAVPFYLAGVLTHSLAAFVAILVVPTALGLVWLGPVTSAVQHLVPPYMRATASATFLFINNLIGLGAGTMLPGMVSDALHARFGDEALRYAIAADTGLYVAAAAILFWGARALERDWQQ